ncbi:MAG: hypothetical protein C0467_21935 [Planctomycetaceae bacterium]|nr:hypothetical protein [Planctomycetaceae bacterium]
MADESHTERSTCAGPAPHVAGRWDQLGRCKFPLNRKIEGDLFRYYAPAFAGNFSVDFVVPRNETPRRFFAKGWLKELRPACAGGTPHRPKDGPVPEGFADRLTRLGIPLLHRLEQDAIVACDHGPTPSLPAPPPLEVYKFHHAIFTARNSGRQAVRRSFRSRKDYTASRRSGVEHYLVSEMLGGSRLISATQIISAIQDSSFNPPPSSQPDGVRVGLPLDAFPGRNAVDYLLLDGAETVHDPAGLLRVWNQAASAFIDGYTMISDEPTTDEDRRAYLEFVGQLVRAFLDKKGDVFQRWLRTEREKGFARLLSAESPRDDMGRYFRHLIWVSQVQMARVYGAVMASAWAALAADERVGLNPVESQLFRTMHLPQVALAGLPVAFVRRPLLRWVMRPLLEYFWTGRAAPPGDALSLTTLLARYGRLNEDRRRVDRERHGPIAFEFQDEGHIPAETTAASSTYKESVDHLPVARDSACPICGDHMNPIGKPSRPTEKDVLIDAECPKCGHSLTLRFVLRE